MRFVPVSEPPKKNGLYVVKIALKQDGPELSFPSTCNYTDPSWLVGAEFKVIEWLDESDPQESTVTIVHDGEKWYWCKCESCGWENSSEYCDGGTQIADTGDYSDPCCPVCGSGKIEGEGKYAPPDSYETTFVTMPLEYFIAPYQKAVERMNSLEAEKHWSSVEQAGGITDRFIKPTDQQLLNAAILFNDGKMEPDKIRDMVALSLWVIDRLHENGDITKASSKEDK